MDATGLATGEGLGTVDITVMQDGKGATLAVTVTPVPEASLSKRQRGACALDETGTAYCWGHIRFGQLGNGSAEYTLLPSPVAGVLMVPAADG